MSSNDWYIFYEFDTEDGKICCYKKTTNQYNYNVGNLDIEDYFSDMYELFTEHKCEILDQYDGPRGIKENTFTLSFVGTECKYQIGTYKFYDYRTAKYNEANYKFKILTPKEFIDKYKPLLADKNRLKAEMLKKIEKKSANFIKQREKYLQEQEQEYLQRREYLPEAEKVLRLFKYNSKN